MQHRKEDIQMDSMPIKKIVHKRNVNKHLRDHVSLTKFGKIQKFNKT